MINYPWIHVFSFIQSSLFHIKIHQTLFACPGCVCTFVSEKHANHRILAALDCTYLLRFCLFILNNKTDKTVGKWSKKLPRKTIFSPFIWRATCSLVRIHRVRETLPIMYTWGFFKFGGEMTCLVISYILFFRCDSGWGEGEWWTTKILNFTVINVVSRRRHNHYVPTERCWIISEKIVGNFGQLGLSWGMLGQVRGDFGPRVLQFFHRNKMSVAIDA